MHKCSEIQNFQTELKYLNLFNLYCIFTNLKGPPLGLEWMDGVWGAWGYMGVWGCPTHVCMYMHMYTHVHACINMIISIADGCPMGKLQGKPYEAIHTYACVHGTPFHRPTPTPTHIYIAYPPSRGPPNQLKYHKSGTNWDISTLFEDLKSVETSSPMGRCIVWWMVGVMDGVM